MSAGARILVIEDEAPIRRFLRIALEAAGFAVEEAERGRLGIELAATRAPDLVVLDLGLPDMDGRAVIAAIRDWSTLPILVLSARDAEGEKVAADNQGSFVVERPGEDTKCMGYCNVAPFCSYYRERYGKGDADE